MRLLLLTAFLCLTAGHAPAQMRTIERDQVACRTERGVERCRAFAAPRPAHRSSIPSRAYVPFEREPVEVRERRPFER